MPHKDFVFSLLAFPDSKPSTFHLKALPLGKCSWLMGTFQMIRLKYYKVLPVESPSQTKIPHALRLGNCDDLLASCRAVSLNGLILALLFESLRCVYALDSLRNGFPRLGFKPDLIEFPFLISRQRHLNLLYSFHTELSRFSNLRQSKSVVNSSARKATRWDS